MSGGFYDPRVPQQGGSNVGTLGLCLRGKDPTVFLPQPPGPPMNPPFGNGLLPIGCIVNSRILNMPLPYVINATAAYPQTFSFFPTEDQTVIAGPFTYGRQLVITTDIGDGGATLLTYHDAVANADNPPWQAHSPSTSASVAQGFLNRSRGGDQSRSLPTNPSVCNP